MHSLTVQRSRLDSGHLPGCLGCNVTGKMGATEGNATPSCQLSQEMEVREKLLGQKLLGHREQACTPAAFCPGLPAHTIYLLWASEVTVLEHKIRVTKQWHRATSHLKYGRILSAHLRQPWIRYLRLLSTERLWQGSVAMINPLFDEMTLCDYCTLKQFLYPLFLSLGFFSEDIFIIHQMRKKKNK